MEISMKKLIVFLFALSVLGSVTVFADEEPTPDATATTEDEQSQLPEGVEPLPESPPQQ